MNSPESKEQLSDHLTIQLAERHTFTLIKNCGSFFLRTTDHRNYPSKWNMQISKIYVPSEDRRLKLLFHKYVSF